MPSETAKSEKEIQPVRVDQRSRSFFHSCHSFIQQTPLSHLVCASSVLNLGAAAVRLRSPGTHVLMSETDSKHVSKQ